MALVSACWPNSTYTATVSGFRFLIFEKPMFALCIFYLCAFVTCVKTNNCKSCCSELRGWLCWPSCWLLRGSITIVWLNYYNKIKLKLIIKYKFKQKRFCRKICAWQNGHSPARLGLGPATKLDHCSIYI